MLYAVCADLEDAVCNPGFFVDDAFGRHELSGGDFWLSRVSFSGHILLSEEQEGTVDGDPLCDGNDRAFDQRVGTGESKARRGNL